MALYGVYAHYTTGPLCEVVFFDRASAEAWANAENDKVQADLYEVESVNGEVGSLANVARPSWA